MYHFFANKKELALVAIGEKMSQRFSDKYGRITKLEGGYVEESDYLGSIDELAAYLGVYGRGG